MLAELAVHRAGLVERGLGIEVGAQGSGIDLLKVGCARLELGRGDIKGDGALGEAQRIEVRALGVQVGLDIDRAGNDFRDLGNGAAVDDLDAGVVGIVIDIRQHRVGTDPVKVSPLAAARGPLVGAPLASDAGRAVFRVVPHVRPAGAGIIAVRDPRGEVEDPGRAAGDTRGGGSELALVLIVHLHGLAENIDTLASWNPGEAVGGEQLVVTSQSGEVMAVGIAMTLRKHVLGIIRIDRSVGRVGTGLFLDVVVDGID